jgi:WD40 repeat protein
MPNQKPTENSSSLLAPNAIPDILPALPQPLALSLKDYTEEADPYKKLIRLCQSAEMIIRVLDAISFAVLYQAAPAAFPAARLKQALHGDLEGKCPISRPTFGEWLTMLLQAAEEIRSIQSPSMPGLAEFAHEVCHFVRPKSTPPPNLCILDLRNAIAHSARFSSAHANSFLETHGHARRFEGFWLSKAAPFFADIEFCAISANGKAALLHGPIESSLQITRTPSATFTNPPPANSIIVTHKKASVPLDLSPMLFFAQACNLTGRQLTPITTDEVTHAYARQADPNEYEIMHPSIIAGFASQTVQERFDRLFPVKLWRQKAEERERLELEANQEKKLFAENLRPYAFRDIKETLLNEPFVGRARQLNQILEWAKATPQGCGLVLGPPGMGKTALAVRTVVEIAKRYKRALTIPFFFKVGDPRCSLRSFVHALLLHIQAKGGPKAQMPNSEEDLLASFENALKEFLTSKLGGANPHDKLVVVLDGINEIAQVCPRFPELLLSWSFKNLLWLGFTQPSATLQSALSSRSATQLFDPPGLPPLDLQDVRTLLMEELGPRVLEFVNAESSDGRSVFLEELSRRSGSLPLYLHCLISDLRKGEFNFNQPHKLPASLEDLYSTWLACPDLDPSSALVPHIIALCATASMPLTEGMVRLLLQDDPQSHDKDWAQILAAGLQFASRYVKPAYFWEGLNGLTIFHQSFREHLLGRKDNDFSHARLAPVIRLAQKRLTQMCLRWREWRADSPERFYALRHLVHHLAEQKNWSSLFASVTELEFLEEKLKTFGSDDVVSDLQLAAKSLQDKTQAAFLQELAEAIQTNADFLARHPTSLFQCAWNTMAHGVAIPTPPASQSTASPNLATAALENWHDQIKTRGTPWLRTLHPPLKPPGQTPVVHLGTGSPILRTLCSEDGRMIAGFAFPQLQKDFSLQPGHTFAWRRAGGTAMKWPWQQGRFAFPLGFGSKGEHLLLATESAIEVWSLPQGFISHTLPAIRRRIVATASAQGANPFTLLTSDGTLYRWPGHTCGWETESLHLLNEVVCADLGAGGKTWLLVTANGEVLSKGQEPEVTRSRLPGHVTLPLKVFRDESGRVGTATNESDLLTVSYHGQKRAHVDLVVEPALGADNTEAFFKFYSALLSPVAACSQLTQSVAILTTEKIDTTSFHDDEFYRGVLHTWSVQSPNEVRRITTLEQNCSAFAISPVGDTVAIGLTNGKVLLLQTNEPHQCSELAAHPTPITSMAFSPDGRFVASSSTDTFIEAARTGGSQAQLHIGEPAASVSSSDGQYFASADQSRRIIVWDSQAGAPLHVLVPKTTKLGAVSHIFGHEGDITALAFLPASDKLVSIGQDSCFWIWNPRTGEPITTESLDPTSEVSPPRMHVAFSADKSRLALMDASGELAVWDIQDDLKKVYAAPKPLEDPQALAISPPGDVLAVCADGKIQFINLRLGKPIVQIPAPKALLKMVPWTSHRVLDDFLASLVGKLLKPARPDASPSDVEDTKGTPPRASEPLPYKITCEPRQPETCVLNTQDGNPVAWYPRPLSLIATAPDGRTFLGFFGSTAHIVRVEQ